MNFLDELLTTTGFAIDLESTGTDWKRDTLTRVGFAYEYEGKLKSISVHPNELLDENQDVDERFLHLLEEAKYKKIGSDIKFDCKFLTQNYKVIVEGIWWDTVKAAKLIDENDGAGLKDQAFKYMQVQWGKWKPLKAWLKLNPGCDEADYEKWLTKYNADDALYTYRLAKEFQKPLLDKEQQTDKFETEMETVRVFYKAETIGLRLNTDRLEVLLAKYTRYEARVKKYMSQHLIDKRDVSVLTVMYKAGPKTIDVSDINYKSPKQIHTLIYDVLNCTPQYAWAKQKAGRKKVLTINAKALVTWARDDDVMFTRWLLFYRYFAKLVSTIEKLLNEAIDGIKYQDYNTCSTETARFSEHDLQCIPGRTNHGVAIRKCFIANKSKKLWVADFSNVELRILAHFTRDPQLLEIYREGGHGDLHKAFASILFDIPIDKVSKSMRGRAKTINFGISYGMSAWALKNSLNQDPIKPWHIRKTKVTLEEAQVFIDKFYQTYGRVMEWKRKTINDCIANGYVTDIIGRKRRISFQGIPQYYKDQRSGVLKTSPKWAAKEREAVNAPIQMSSASITKLAIEELSKKGYLVDACSISMQVHDELVGDIYDESKLDEIKAIMEGVIKLTVPLIVDCKLCDNWSEGK